MTGAYDVIKRDELERWIYDIDADRPLDLVIANAGISRHPRTIEDMDATTRQVFGPNIDGVVNTVHPALIRMVERKSGQIAIMSSIAGLVTLPHAPAYCASKAAVRVYGKALRMRHAREASPSMDLSWPREITPERRQCFSHAVSDGW